MITVLLFAALKDVVGNSQLELEQPTEATGLTVADLKRELVRLHPKLEKWLPHVRVAVNQDYANDATTIEDGAEVALIPPVSGGSNSFVQVREAELSLDEVVRAVQSQMGGRAGAICTFLGVVRANSTDPQGQSHDDIVALDYEAYAPMAERELGKICREASEKWGATCAITHRTGILKVGEASVAMAVATPHRAESFEACRYLIEELKKRVPIWKKETAQSGFWWVEGTQN